MTYRARAGRGFKPVSINTDATRARYFPDANRVADIDYTIWPGE